MANVSIIQRRMVRYRLRFFEALKATLDKQGINLRVLHGTPLPSEEKKGDTGILPWAEDLPSKYLARDRLCWQPFSRATRGDDLVVITQENRLISNHLALLAPRKNRLAFWGHGANLQRSSYGWKDRYKDWTTCQVDWWFAYTRLSVDLVARAGFPEDRITCVNNSIDTQKMLADLETSALVPRSDILRKFNLKDGRFGLFIGALYSEKRLDFLIDTAVEVRREVADFQLLIVGSGPHETALRQHVYARNAEDYIHFMGAQHGVPKAELLLLSAVILNPGLVGLGIFDALCAGRPLLTTDCRIHSPEIVYLDERVGTITDNTQEAYIQEVIDTLNNEKLRHSAAEKGPEVARQYGVIQMAERFANGIERALG